MNKKGMSKMWWIIGTAIIVIVIVALILLWFQGGWQKGGGVITEQFEDTDNDGVLDALEPEGCVGDPGDDPVDARGCTAAQRGES